MDSVSPGGGDADTLDGPDAHDRATRGGALRASGYLIGLIVAAGSAALIFRHLSQVDSGLYVTGTSLIAIVAQFSDSGLTAVGMRELAQRSGAERWELARSLLGLRLVLTVPAGAIITAIAWVAYSPAVGRGVALAAVGLVLTVTQDNFSLPLSLELRLGRQAILDLTRQVLSVLCLVGFALAGGGLIAFMATPIPVGIVAIALTLWMVGWRRRRLTPRLDPALVKAFLVPVLPYTVALAAAALYLRAALLLVSALAGRHQLADFSLSFRVVEAAMPIPGLLIGSTLPVLARAAGAAGDGLDRALERLHRLYLVIGAWVAVSVAVGAPLAVTVIGGARYHAAGPVLALQGIALGAMFVSSVWGYGLLSLTRYRQILLINVSGLLLNLVMVVVLYQADGIAGAALATGIVEIGSAALQAIVTVRQRPGLHIPLRGLGPVAVASAAGLVPLALAPVGVPVLIRLVLSTGFFALAVCVLGAVPPELAAGAGVLRRRLGAPR